MKKKFLNRALVAIGIIGFIWGCELKNIESVTDPEIDENQEELSSGENQTQEDTTNSSTTLKIPAFSETKAFPTAEGYGRFTKGGRGGKIVYVTNLEDNSNAGSFRYALEQVSEPRIVVFKVAGIIELNSVVKIEAPYITIAGQSAPGSGITIKNAGIQIETHDVIIRHMRLRPGDGTSDEAPSDRDALTIYKNRNCHNIMLDQVSFTWGIDENVDFSTGTNNLTIQNCIIAEGLSHSLHEEGEHSKGLLMLNDLDNISIVNNLFAHNMNRNPIISSNSRNIHVVNNLIYNWGPMAAGYGTHTQIFQDKIPINDAVIYRNVYRKGATSHNVPLYRTGNFYLVDGSTFFIDENYMDEGGVLYDLKEVSPSYNKYTDFYTFIVDKAPNNWDSGYSTIHAPEDVVDYVLSHAGARKPILDAVDERIINESQNFTGDFIDSPKDKGGYPEQFQGQVPTDTDGDGMSDKWEMAEGLDPDSAEDGNSYTLSPYYTNVEMYLNELAGDYQM